MFPFSRSPISTAVMVALMFSTSTSLYAQTQEQTDTSATDSDDVVTVVGSQVKLGDEYEGGQVATTGRAGLLGNVDTMDTPFSSTNYTEQLIRDQQAVSVADVVQNDPTVRVARGFGNFQELYMIRGFPVYSDDLTLNGVYGILPRQFVAAEMIERVEVFRGANTFLNGAAPGGSSVGGTINLVPKRAHQDPITRLTVGTETGGQLYSALDVGRRFGAENENGIRVNAVTRDGDTAIDDQERRLGMFTLGFDHSSDNFRFSADLGYQDHKLDDPRPSVTPNGYIPSAPDSSSNYAQDWTYSSEKQLFGVVRGEYDFSQDTMAWLAVGARQGREHNVLANPTMSSGNEMDTYLFENAREDKVISSDSGIKTHFSTWDVGHTVVASFSAYREKRYNAYAMSSYNALSTSLTDPTDYARPTITSSAGDMDDPVLQGKTNTTSFALADTLSFLDDSVLLTLGGRYQNINTETFDYNTGVSNDDEYDASRFSPFAGVVYKPSYSVSLYTNYSEALIPGSEVGSSYDNRGEVLKPYQSKQVETGIKYDQGLYGMTLSLFRQSLPSGIAVNNVYSSDGEERHQGIEFSAFGSPTENIRILGGATFVDSEIVNSESGTYEGNDAIGVPKVQGNINLEWDASFLPGLVLEGRTVYTGKQYVDQANTLRLPSWTRFDLGARYSFKVDENDMTVRLRVENVADRNYWASAGGSSSSANYLVLGDPRTVTLSASYDF
ncbi:TonB-dependent siderophore receptor [Vibrio sp.]|nr:TonB-dependent siderophore receptor [Vibrio sp.]